MSVVEKPAAFVLVRLAGAALALTGATFLGLLLSAAWCLDTEAAAATCGLFAGSATLLGMAASVMAWWPRRAVGAVLIGGLVTLLAWPFVASRADAREAARAERTREALSELGRVLSSVRDFEPDREAPISAWVREMPEAEGLSTVDGWGHPIVLRLDVPGWSLVARCRCGRPDELEGHSHVGPPVVGPRADMAWSGGELERWPGDLEE